MNQDEVESQLSAMFDGELPAAECELLSRRIDRDENLRARWARYALIGAAMRFEPVATARSDFAARVSSAVDRDEAQQTAAREAQVRGARRRNLMWQGSLAATLIGAVAGLSVMMLRNVALNSVASPEASLLAARSDARAAHAVLASLPAAGTELLARQREALAVLGGNGAAPRSVGVRQPNRSASEPWSYVTPPASTAGNNALRTELVDYIVAHSAYSTPLMRPDLLSTLISGEQSGDTAPLVPAAHATTAASAAGR